MYNFSGMGDTVTNPYTNTDLFGKANLINHPDFNGSLSVEKVRDFYNSKYGMTTPHWNALFGNSNPIYANSGKGVIQPISTLFKQKTVKTETVELITADIVIQVMKQIENAMKISSSMYTRYRNECEKSAKNLLEAHIIYENNLNLFNEYIINQVMGTRVARRYLIIEDEGNVNASFAEIKVFNHNGHQISISADKITTSSVWDGNYVKEDLVNGRAVTTDVHEAWHSGQGGYNDRRKSLVPYSDRMKHHVIIDFGFGVQQDISKIEIYSRYQSKDSNGGGAGVDSDLHTLYLTDHLDWKLTTVHPVTVSEIPGTTDINKYFSRYDAKWIQGPRNAGTGFPAGIEHPTTPSQTVFTYVFDTASQPSDLSDDSSTEFLVNMTGYDTATLYLNGKKQKYWFHGYNENISWQIPSSFTVQGRPGINRFDFVVQRKNDGVNGLLASVDYKTSDAPPDTSFSSAQPSHVCRYVIVQLEYNDYATWAGMYAFNEWGHQITPVSSALSSEYGGWGNGYAERLIDNSPNFSHTHNTPTTIHSHWFGGPWAMIDLGQEQKVSSVAVVSRENEYQSRQHPHRVYLSKTFDGSNAYKYLSSDALAIKSTSGLGVARTYNRSRRWMYTMKYCKAKWEHAFKTGDDAWTMSESHRTMLGSDVIQIPSMSAKHEDVSANRYQRKTIYEFPSAVSAPQVDLGGSPVSFTVESITKYRYVVVQTPGDVLGTSWTEIIAYDVDNNIIPVLSSALSTTGLEFVFYGTRQSSTRHHDNNLNTSSRTQFLDSTKVIGVEGGLKVGSWAMIDFGEDKSVHKIKLVGGLTQSIIPHRVFLADTFDPDGGIDLFGVNTLELTNQQSASGFENNLRTFTYNIPGMFASEISWEISQDTDGKVVASKDYPGLGTQSPIPTETVQLSSEHHGYTGSYTLTLRDSMNDGWDRHWNMKVTSTDAYGYTTVRAVTQGVPEIRPANGNKRVMRIHLPGDTTPIRDHPSNGAGVIQFRLSPSQIYKNKLSRMKTILYNADGTHTASRDHILNIYHDIRNNISQYWTSLGDKYGSKSNGAIGLDMINAWYWYVSRSNDVRYSIMNDLTAKYFSDDDEISLYELQPLNSPANSFIENKIIYTNRLSDIEKTKPHALSYLMNNSSKVRNGRSMTEYANEFAIEMLHNSSLSSFNFTNNTVSDLPLSVGYAVVKHPNNDRNILNVRIYVSYVFTDIFSLTGTRQIAISSGVNLLDSIDISKFAVGITSSNFLTYLSSALMILNSDEGVTTNFESSNTKWEYGYPSKYDSLKCISSTNSYWEGQLIKDCYLLGSSIDIPKRVFNMIRYLNTNYSELEDGQFIIFNQVNGKEKIISLIKIIKSGNEIAFQHKDGRVDNIFPINNINADMLITGELQVENYKGDMLLHVDPVSDKTTVMGKFGVNQELHEITAMVDIDNLSNQNMSRFVDKFAPLILNTVTNMKQQITFNPYLTSDPTYYKAARYVIVQIDTNDYSNWAEIQAFGPDDSIYIPTSGEVSHQYWTFDESKHRDGNIDTFSHTYKDSTFALAPGKEDSGRSYAFIDLGNVRPISKIKLISREGYPDGNPRTSPHRVFLSHTWTNEYWGGAQVDIDNYVAMSSSSSYLISKNTVNNIQTTYTYDPSINENTLGSMQDVVTVQSDYTAITLPLSIFTTIAPPVQETRNNRFGKIQARVELPVRIYAVTNEYRILSALNTRISDAEDYLDRLEDALDAAEDRADDAAMLKFAIKAAVVITGAGLAVATGGASVGLAAVASKALISSIGSALINAGADAATGAINDKIEGDEDEIKEMIKNQQDNVIPSLKSLRNTQAGIVVQKEADMILQAGFLNMEDIYTNLLNAQTRLLLAMRLYATIRGYISEKVNDYFFTPTVTTCYRPITAARYIYGEDVDTYLSRNNNKFKFKTKDSVGVVSEWFNIYERSSPLNTWETSVKDDIRGKIALYEPMTMKDFITMVITDESPIFGRQADALVGMQSDVENSTIAALEYLETYLYTAKVAVDNANNVINNHEVTQVSNAMKIKDALNRAAMSNVKTFAEWQEDIDNVRVDYDASVVRYKALDWLIATNPPGHQTSAGDHHEMFGRCKNGDLHDHYRGNVNHFYGYIYYELDLYKPDMKLNQVAANIRSKAIPELAKEKTKRDKLKVELDSLIASQSGLMDELQEYTFAHDWDSFTHNRLKQVISNLYRMYLVHGDVMKETKLSYSCIIPVTTNSDNLTSAMYIKIVPMFDNEYPQIAISGRMLDVNDFTRDKSYRDTLMLLMGSFTAASQLVNYGSVLVSESISHDGLLLSTRIKNDNLFIDRFGYGSLFLVVDNMTESKVAQHELYSHWNNNKFSSLFYPDSNICVADAYDLLNKEFINKYGFDPLNMSMDSTLLTNTFMVPFKYDDSWKIVIMRYLPIGLTLYRVSCIIDVNDYIDQSIIAKGDSTFYGDLTVKSSSNQEMFQVDTLNNVTSNLYPFSIGTHKPRTMLDIRDTSIIDMNYFMSKVSSGLREITSGILTHNIITNNDDYIYSYRLNRVTNNASDTVVLEHGLYPEWSGATYAQIIASDPDRAGLIEEFVLPSLQESIDNTLFYPGSIYSSRIPFVSGVKFSVHTVITVQPGFVDVIGRGWNLQEYGINVITNPNIIKLFDSMNATIKYANFINRIVTTDIPAPIDVRYISDTYPNISKNVYKYTLVDTTASVLDNLVTKTSISPDYKVVSGGTPVVISNVLDTSERVFHTSFIVTYLKDYGKTAAAGSFGIIECRDSNHYYYTTFFKLDVTTIIVFYVNMSTDYMRPSVALEGDMTIAGELSLSGLTTGENASSKYITIDPENHFLGINSNDRFVNYALDYTTLGSVFNTSHHMFVKNNAYPNAAFGRIAEKEELGDAATDYSLFGSYSSTTMVRISEMWDYAEIQERVVELNKTLTSVGETEPHWMFKRYYGPDISFEIKDKTGLTTELGEVKMVIDRVDDNGILHGGFGVQMVDPNLAGASSFDNSLKNIMYVNNDGEMYVSGVFLGNKLLKVNPTNDAELLWGDKKLVFKEQLDAVVASEASLQARVTALETAVLALQQQSSGGG